MIYPMKIFSSDKFCFLKIKAFIICKKIMQNVDVLSNLKLSRLASSSNMSKQNPVYVKLPSAMVSLNTKGRD